MSEQNNQPGTAVARQQTQVAIGSPLGDLDQAYRLSQALALASIVPNDLRGKPGNVLAIILYGQDLGMSPMQAIQGIYVVKGKPQLSGTTWLALARRAGHKVRFPETTNERCTIEITRSDDPQHPHVETYTLEDAVTANLVRIKDGKPFARGSKGDPLPWEQYTRTMIRNRCISNAAKAACPEVALGFAVEGDYDYITEAAEVAPPEHHGEVVDAEVVTEEVDAEVANLAQQYDFTTPTSDAEIKRGRYYPEMPPALPGETDAAYTDRLTGADGTDRRPYDHRRNRQCSIGSHGECTDSAGENCQCPCHSEGQTEELPPPPANYACGTCQAVGEHYEDECPKAVTPS